MTNRTITAAANIALVSLFSLLPAHAKPKSPLNCSGVTYIWGCPSVCCTMYHAHSYIFDDAVS